MMKRIFLNMVGIAALVGMLSVPAYATETSPVSVRAVGGSQLGGTWNVALTGLGKLVSDRYPGSTFNVLQGASVSNPLRLETNSGDVTITQGFNTYAAMNGVEPYDKKLANIAAIANVNDTTRMQIIASKKLNVTSFDEIIERKLPIRLERGAKGTLQYVLGQLILASYGVSYDDIESWGGKVTTVSGNDLVGLMQDGTIDVAFKLGPGEQAQIQEMVLNVNVVWLDIDGNVLKEVAEKTGLSTGFVPSTFYNNGVGRDVPCIVDTTNIIVRKNMSEEDVYKITRSLVEGLEELGNIQPTWRSMTKENISDNLSLPLHAGAEKYYREVGIIE